MTAENVPCGSTGVTCTKSVTLSLGNTVIHLLRGERVSVTVEAEDNAGMLGMIGCCGPSAGYVTEKLKQKILEVRCIFSVF